LWFIFEFPTGITRNGDLWAHHHAAEQLMWRFLSTGGSSFQIEWQVGPSSAGGDGTWAEVKMRRHLE